MNNLTKRDLVIAISNETGLIQSDVFNVIQRTLDHISNQISKGGRVELRDFGVFDVRIVKERIGRDPKKPDLDVVIPPRAVVKFKAGKGLRNLALQKMDKASESEDDELEDND